MTFSHRTHGGIVEPVPGVTPEALRPLLPASVRSDPRADAFLSAELVGVVEIVERFANMREDDPATTPAENKRTLEDVADKARRLSRALQPLRGASDTFEALEVQFEHLRLRADERGSKPTEGRPVVPALPPGLPRLDQLLARSAEDLATLTTACDYAAERITPAASVPRGRDRQMVRAIAESYRQHFGKLPPRGRESWFELNFMPYIGKCLGVTIGRRVVEEAMVGMS